MVLPGNRLVINDCYVEAGMACLMKYGTDTMQGQFISADGKEVGKDDVSEVVHVQTGEGKKKKVPTRTAAKWSDSLMSCKIRIGAHPRIGVSFYVVCLIAIFSSLYILPTSLGCVRSVYMSWVLASRNQARKTFLLVGRVIGCVIDLVSKSDYQTLKIQFYVGRSVALVINRLLLIIGVKRVIY